MPFVYDETEIEWPDDDSEPPPPRPDQFVYLPPPQFGGAREPVQFSIMSPGVATDASEPQWKKLDRQALAIMVPALREIGGRRAYCRYDGGHDEGFAWLDSIELCDGARINADAVAQQLYDIQVHSRLRAAGLLNLLPKDFSDLEQLRHHIRHWLCNEWATMLLGDSYGTGEYSMYGAFTVDLEACTIADDTHADPVVENIAIAT